MMQTTMVHDELDTPFGPLWISADDAGIRRIAFGATPPEGVRDPARMQPARAQLRAYLNGELAELSLPLAPVGTPFQLAVWRALRTIERGETQSYGALARALGRPGAARAVGRANATNPIAIAIPCHRVVGSRGDLTGYAYGVEVKRWLLELERRHISGASGASNAATLLDTAPASL
jgi:methylated-DNA-[protein]-cysteine S-methyltransferase